MEAPEKTQAPEKQRLTKKEKKEQKYLRLKEKYKEKKTKRTRRKRAPENQEISNYKIWIEVVGGISLMTEKEMRSLFEQIRYIYASNRIAQHPVQLTISNASLLKDYLRDDISNWKNIHFTDESVLTAGIEKVLVLSADSENILTEMEEDTVYLIGGLVDRNRHKGHVQKVFGDKFRTARLPITQKLTSSKVLSTLHVFNILQAYTETKNWQYALEQHLPIRKQERQEEKEKKDTEEKKEKDNAAGDEVIVNGTADTMNGTANRNEVTAADAANNTVSTANDTATAGTANVTTDGAADNSTAADTANNPAK